MQRQFTIIAIAECSDVERRRSKLGSHSFSFAAADDGDVQMRSWRTL